jgi:C4-dicarboxylate transporter, DctQ subunit
MGFSKVFAQGRRFAEHVMVGMMAVMFIAFIAQVVFRYVLNKPLGWTDELSTQVWLWGILWGAAFVMRNNEDIRFDMLYNLLPNGPRRWLTVFSSCSIVGILLLSFPATWAYVSFMKVEKSASMGLPMNWVFSIYIVFLVAMIIRHSHIAWMALNNVLVQDQLSAAIADATQEKGIKA